MKAPLSSPVRSPPRLGTRFALSRVVRLARAPDLGAVSRATERGTRLIDLAGEGEA